MTSNPGSPSFLTRRLRRVESGELRVGSGEWMLADPAAELPRKRMDERDVRVDDPIGS